MYSTRVVATLALLLTLGSCGGGTVRRPVEVGNHEMPSGVLSLQWHLPVHTHGLFEPWPEECATGVVDRNFLYLGSRNRQIIAVNLRTASVEWTTKVDPQIDSEAVIDPVRNHLLVGGDDGTLFVVDRSNGRIVWTWKGEGSMDRRPAFDQDRIYVATSQDKLYALDAKTGKPVWSYDRDRPEGFSIHGYSAPVVVGGQVYAGFSDGFIVSLDARSGDIVWARSLASASEQFVDVDTTPAYFDDVIVAASHSGGLYGLDRVDGKIRWRHAIDGVGVQTLVRDTLYFVAPRGGLHAADPRTGQIAWRYGLSQAGEVTAPQAAGPYLLFSSSKTGLNIVRKKDGELLQTFHPGRGLCAGAAIDAAGRNAYVLSNGGTLYALAINW